MDIKYPRPARVAGTIACPLVMLVASFYTPRYGIPQLARDPSTIFLALLSLCPLCSSAAAGSARMRRWFERLTQRPRLSTADH